MNRLLPCLVTCALAAGSLGAQQPAPPPGFDAYVTQVMTAFQVPGLSVAIVKDGQVVLAKGYGVRQLGKPAAIRFVLHALRNLCTSYVIRT